jgi:hypothetical protein
MAKACVNLIQLLRKTVRIDVYDPTMTVFEPFDTSVSDYVPQTDKQVTHLL